MSLLSIIKSFFESLIAAKVSNLFDKNHLLNNRKFGFRHGRPTSDLMLYLSSEWQKSLDKGEAAIVTAYDISGALDHV